MASDARTSEDGLAKLEGAPEWIALRMDDVGASTKRYNVYSRHSWKLGPVRISGDWFFLKYLPAYRGWGPYREMKLREWREVLSLLDARGAKLTVAVTAAWVEWRGTLVPFPEKFPAQAAILKDGVDRGLIEIANHGLTHCVLENNAFRPRLFKGNREYHREFWDWVPERTHEEHIRRSQQILSDYFERDIVSFVAPGNIFTDRTLHIAGQNGVRYFAGKGRTQRNGNVTVLGEGESLAFHDRDIVLHGIGWLERALDAHAGKRFYFFSELGRQRRAELDEGETETDP